jgi:molybdate transport system regulatory protein
MKLSARNQLKGTVSHLTPGAVNTEVVIALTGGGEIVSVITNAAAEGLGLVEGSQARAIIKASSVMVGVED